MEEIGKPLGPGERDLLWMASQGYSYERIGRMTRQNPGSISNAFSRIARRLGTYNVTHSVAHAIYSGLIGPARDCGTRRAYLRHLRKNESACVACRMANTAYVHEQRDTPPEPGDPVLTPTQTKILMLLDEQGGTYADVAQVLGVTLKRVSSHMSAIYQRMGLAHLHRNDRRDAVIRVAKTRGLIP